MQEFFMAGEVTEWIVMSENRFSQHPIANIKYLFNKFTLNALSPIENSHKPKFQSISSRKSFKFSLPFEIKYANIFKTFSSSSIPLGTGW